MQKQRIHSALDETLWQKPELLEQIPEDAIAALILKPNRLGGISAALQFARYAERHKLHAVFSSAFESGISLSFYTWLAASTASKPAACGLDTYRYLKHDLLQTPFGAENALLDTRKLYQEGVNVNERTSQAYLTMDIISRAAQLFGNSAALRIAEHNLSPTLSFIECDKQAQCIANTLYRSGVRAGDIVAIVSPNTAERYCFFSDC